MTIPKRGRPSLDRQQRSTSLHLRLPSADLAQTKQMAARDRESVQDVIRRGLRRILDDGKRIDR